MRNAHVFICMHTILIAGAALCGSYLFNWREHLCICAFVTLRLLTVQRVPSRGLPPWLDTVPPQTLTVTGETIFSELIVVTTDVVRYKWLINHLTVKDHHVLCVGPTGTGVWPGGGLVGSLKVETRCVPRRGPEACPVPPRGSDKVLWPNLFIPPISCGLFGDAQFLKKIQRFIFISGVLRFGRSSCGHECGGPDGGI